MKKFLFLFLALFACESRLAAQNVAPAPAATETIQQSQSASAGASQALAPESVEPADPKSQVGQSIPIKIPAGTPIEVEVAYTVSSLDIKPGELLSFRVLIPIIIEGATAIEKGALVTARVTLAKRGGHWGKAGRLAWSMEDVVAADNTRILLDPATHSRDEALWNLEGKGQNSKTGNPQVGQGSLKGTSHKGEVTTKTIIAAAIFPPLAPLALMNGFRRGENAVLPEGKRYVVAVRRETSISVTRKN
jgi:hypothetical protein